MERDNTPQAGQGGPAPEPERLIGDAMLIAVGELGYEATTVQDVLDRSGVSRGLFYQRFKGKYDCYAAASEAAAQDLCAAMLAAGRGAESWEAGLRAGLEVLLEFVAERPATARALLIEIRAASGTAEARYDEIVERLTRAVDSARRQPGSRHRAPPLTATLMIEAIQGVVRGLLAGDRAQLAPARLPDLMYLVMLNYFGEEAAFAAMDAARGDGPRAGA